MYGIKRLAFLLIIFCPFELENSKNQKIHFNLQETNDLHEEAWKSLF
jgi:hypothetical protein